MGLRRYLGQHARDSHTAGLVIASGALVFNLVWLFTPPAIRWYSPPGPTTTGLLFFVVATLNAYVATRIVWWAFVPTDRSFSRRRAAAVGLGLAPVSMFTLSALGLPRLLLLEDVISGSPATGFPTSLGEFLTFPLTLLYLGLLGTVYGFYLTLGIPLLITTAGALALAHLENQYG